jgi:hypothetical protein
VILHRSSRSAFWCLAPFLHGEPFEFLPFAGVREDIRNLPDPGSGGRWVVAVLGRGAMIGKNERGKCYDKRS